MLHKENDGQSFNLGFSWDTSTSSYAWNIMSCEIFIIDHKFHWPQACLNREAFICSRTCLNCEAPFMTTELHNAIMKRSRYRNKFLKDKSQTSRENYKIQRNLCKKLLRKTKKSYFESLNTKKSRIIEPSGKLLFLFSQIRCQEVKRLSLLKQKTCFGW